ncbi:PREDICTED: uncharacterized protein LOC106806251 [Priapulus caudatus]|uniref:Uncharacterized protein LOC106806251 n=1 Tax=Priapulus caudatus TaxID=37621 RepID=A0ABM1DUJ1_PRICU|nr:PREDICTED: uncharacterized protein LOC106806251 [Priapulus caudatus]
MEKSTADDDDVEEQRPDSGASSVRASRCQQCRSATIKFIAYLFSNVGLVGLVVGYCVIGAFMFSALELDNELERKKAMSHTRRIYSSAIVQRLRLSGRHSNDWVDIVSFFLEGFEQNLTQYMTSDGFDGSETRAQPQWEFIGSLLYCVTLVTTIGYGNIAPKTPEGRIVTIFYAAFGIPLTLLCLANLGDYMAVGFKMFYNRVICYTCRERQAAAAPRRKSTRRTKPPMKSSIKSISLAFDPNDKSGRHYGNAYSIDKLGNCELPLPDYTHRYGDLPATSNVIMVTKPDGYAAVGDGKKEQKQTRTEELRNTVRVQTRNAQEDNDGTRDGGKPSEKEGNEMEEEAVVAEAAKPKDGKRWPFWRYTLRDKMPQNKHTTTAAADTEQGTTNTADGGADSGDGNAETLLSLESRCLFADCSDSEDDRSQDCNITKETVVEYDLLSTPTLTKKTAYVGDRKALERSRKEEGKGESTSQHSITSRSSERGSVMFKDERGGDREGLAQYRSVRVDEREVQQPKSEADLLSGRYPQYPRIANQEQVGAKSSPTRVRAATFQRHQTMPSRRKPRLVRAPSKTLSLSPGSRSPRTDDTSVQSVSVDVAQKPPDVKDNEVPISVSIILLGGYVFGGAWLFNYMEGWNDLTKGAYFTFITLSTIGLGDIVPGSTFLSGDFGQVRYISITFYVVFGLALISMCFNLMQAGVINKVRRLAKKIGVISDDD